MVTSDEFRDLFPAEAWKHWKITLTRKANTDPEAFRLAVADLKRASDELMKCSPGLLIEIVYRQAKTHACGQCGESFEEDVDTAIYCPACRLFCE